MTFDAWIWLLAAGYVFGRWRIYRWQQQRRGRR